MKAHRVSLLLAPVAAVVALVVLGVAVAAGAPVLAAVVAGVASGLVAAAIPYWRAEPAVVGAMRLVPVAEADEPRLHNLVSGLCDSHGFRRPRLAVIEDPALNAVVFGRSRDRITLALTRGLLESARRLELEGLLARQLAQANSGAVPAATVLVPLARLVPASWRPQLVARVLGGDRVVLADFEAVRLTRYPPGLTAALDRLVDASTFVPGAGAGSGHLWLVPPMPGTSGPGISTIRERLDALREL